MRSIYAIYPSDDSDKQGAVRMDSNKQKKKTGVYAEVIK